MLKAAKAYLATQVSTSSQGDLLLMLYDTAIKHLHQAVEKMQIKDFAGKGVLISKAISIISELQASLNKERGGDISKNLFSLYFYCNSRLLTANLKMQPEIVEEVIGILTGLRQAFAQIMPSSADGVASLNQQGVVSEAPSLAPPPSAAGAPTASVGIPAPAAPRPVVSLATARPAPVASSAAPSVYTAPAPASSSVLGKAPEVIAKAPPASEPPTVQYGTPASGAGAPAVPAPTPEPPAPAGPVNPMRFRAANAYATTR